MSRFTVTARGGLLSRSGLTPTGAVVELSDADAASLPPGSVERLPDAPPVVPPAPPLAPTIEAPKGRKAAKP